MKTVSLLNVDGLEVDWGNAANGVLCGYSGPSKSGLVERSLRKRV
jgi:hypothetical protein